MSVGVECVWPLGCRLGEGVVWDAAKQSMFFVDIKGMAVHAYTPAKNAQRSWPMPEMIGWLVPRASGDWVAGFKSGVAALKLGQPSKIDWLHRLHKPGSPMRLNDAKADAQGRLWFGTMNGEDESQPVGVFHRLGADGQLSTQDRGYCVTTARPSAPTAAPCSTPTARCARSTRSMSPPMANCRTNGCGRHSPTTRATPTA
jgi:xylono-1,5-lactonase